MDQPGMRLVGIAASAGGLEALRGLLQGLPESDRVSYVVALQGSRIPAGGQAELLAPHTAIRVVDLVHGDRPRPGTIAIIPPGHDAEIADGCFRLARTENANGARPSADRLFQSLAASWGEAAVGIVLSGTGSDGAAGIREIKSAGGLTIVQDPLGAGDDSLPSAAVHTGRVDLVLPPDQIGPALQRLIGGSGPAGEPVEAARGDSDSDHYAQIARLVRVRTAFRLDEYKAATVRRRIARRLGLLNLRTLADYVEHLRTTPDEAQQLVRDTFVSVTAFFRDTDAWQALERAIGALVREAGPSVLRCWVPGCATGEEAYGIAMLFEEALHTWQRSDVQYMVFASDLDDDALAVARGASYLSRTLDDLPPLLRARYIDMQGSDGRVLKSIRSRVVFARQNVIDDPPFSRIDLISCRNLLIYLNPAVQRRVLELFHYALRPGGQLFLGRSEALDGHADLFAPVDQQARLYQRVEGFQRRAQAWRTSEGPVGIAAPGAAERHAEPQADTPARRMQAQLLQRFAPPSLLLDAANEVVRFEGAIKPFLDFPSGGARWNLFDMVDVAVRAELRALVYRCRREGAPVRGAVHARTVDGVAQEVCVHLEPLAHDNAGVLLLSFVAQRASPAPIPGLQEGSREAMIVAELERELADTREHLVIVVDELQSTNEKLQSASEEQQSSNEELQSTNEELRTVNEELQSANEELLTVNEELQAKTGELEATAAMLTNVKQSLDFPLLVVDRQRRVLDANLACRRLVREADLSPGLAVQGLAWRFPVGALDDDIRRVTDSGERTVRELPGEAGEHHRLHVMPYRTARQEIAGAVLLFEDVTALRGAEDRYRQVTESLPQLVWTCAADGPCDYLSPQWVGYTGVPEAEQLGYGWLEQLHPDDRQHTIDRWTATAGQGLDFETEFRIRRHDGDYRWFHTLARPLRDAQGRIVKWFGSNTDIEDRKRAVGALQVAAETLEQRVAVRTAELERASAELGQALRELEDIYHNARCGYHSIDAQGRILRINDTELRWLGYTRDELIGRPITELLAPSGRATFAANYPRITAGEPLSNLEVEFLRRDGSEIPMLVSATPVFDEQGRYLHSRSVLQDYTLPRAQQRTLRRILTAAPMAVRIARLADQKVVFFNEAYTELVQRSDAEAYGLEVRQFYVDPAAYDRIAARLAAGQTVHNELVELHRPEDPVDRRWALGSYMSVDYEGEPAALAWLFDVTEIERGKRLAEEASQTKSRFLANMSHEIRTPMNGVIGMVDLVRHDVADAVQRDRLDKASGAARQLLAILNDILDLSKIEAGHMREQRAATDLANCLEGTRVLFDAVARQRNLGLVVETDPALAGCMVLADAKRVRQVLDNLVANAIKFSSRGEVRVTAFPEADTADGVTVRFEVRDQGAGIAPEDLPRVFRMFEQVDDSPTRTHEGTGLGLAICSAIVTRLGGEIGANSTVGAGSTFWFRLRFGHAEASPAAGPAPAPLDAAEARRRLAGAQALLAEDNPINQEVQRLALEDLGLAVDVVVDGQEALQAATRRRYDLIFLDMQMPVMNGPDAARGIRAAGPNRTTPIIAMTANAFEDDRRACLAAGMDDFIAKPLALDELPALACAWLEASRRGQDRPGPSAPHQDATAA